MAKTSLIKREQKRLRTVQKYKARRAAWRGVLRDPDASAEDKADAQAKLQRMPRDASPIRLRNRCALTGRPHGYYRKFGLGRNMLREAAMRGDVPGLVKASW